MSLSYDKSGFKTEHAVIAILCSVLVAVLVYFLAFNKNPAPAPVAAPVQAQAVSAAPQQAAPETPNVAAPLGFAMAVGKYEGEVHPLINVLDERKGFKYDNSVAPADTVYIVYDPRCPYCEALFDKISNIDLKEKQITVKWLPSLALGDTPEARAMAAAGMDAKNIEDFESTFRSGFDTSKVKVTQEHEDEFNANMALLFEASDQTFGKDHPKSVPAVFFLDKATGAPHMMYGASDESVFKQIFGE